MNASRMSAGIRDIGSHPARSLQAFLECSVECGDSVISGRPFVSPDFGVETARDQLSPPAFLDFETLIACSCNVCWEPGHTRRVPFQWSMHVRESDGESKA